MIDPAWWSLHEEACARGEATYTDPQSGFVVFTRIGLSKRDRCCGSGCRHCPFGHESVKLALRPRTIQQAAWLTNERPKPDSAPIVLFWSGGKDSYLAYRALSREGHGNVVLLTTFDAHSRMIAHQGTAIDDVVSQAQRLDVPLIGVPLHSGVDYLDHIAPALALVPGSTQLCFGDLHLDHIRQWREDAFAAHPATAALSLSFPLWQVDHAVLLADLAASGVGCEITAIAHEIEGVSIGDAFDAELVARLPATIDPFGENGEFHTRIVL